MNYKGRLIDFFALLYSSGYNKLISSNKSKHLFLSTCIKEIFGISAGSLTSIWQQILDFWPHCWTSINLLLLLLYSLLCHHGGMNFFFCGCKEARRGINPTCGRWSVNYPTLNRCLETWRWMDVILMLVSKHRRSLLLAPNQYSIHPSIHFLPLVWGWVAVAAGLAESSRPST